MDLKNNNVLITGGAGYIGSWVTRYLLEKGYKVYGMERHSSIKNRTNTKGAQEKQRLKWSK